MTRDDLICRHEPFGDAFYYGPERLSPRFEQDEQTRLNSGFSESTYKTILDSFEDERVEVRFPPPLMSALLPWPRNLSFSPLRIRHESCAQSFA